MSKSATKIFVATEHSVYLPAIQMAIRKNKGKLVGVRSRTTKMSLDREIKTTKPEIIIISLENLEAEPTNQKLIDKIRSSSSHLKIITIIHNVKDVPKLLEKKVEGLLLAKENFDELVKAIRNVIIGECYYSPNIRKLAGPKLKSEHVCLTRKEAEVFILLKEEGAQNKDKITKKLNITRSTLRSHIENINKKLGAITTA